MILSTVLSGGLVRFGFLTAVAFVVSISAVARISRGDDVAEGEFEKLAGTWEVLVESEDGRPRVYNPARKVMIVGRSMIVLNKLDSVKYEAKLRNLQPSASPSAVDLAVPKDKEAVVKFPAVYKLDGDDLQICWWFKDEKKPRPDKLEKGEGLRLLVLKRVKETE